ncbi:MAG: VCBS repeat-containing protein [Propionivibrio sp.]|uniref:VCBS repeat-containing protein n=1 Tax=Propionivibrio sp. TaxID=2212460 RepID=UPI001A50E560|nr:VCBS repeat-containing protein [Propionivibrio sp.]MBL8413322.1 VCBS repeat-containing protein [Propionivibrio sp.]
MKIASSALQMESSHNKLQQHEIRESLRTWVGDHRPDFEGNRRAHLPAFDRVQLSDAGKSAQSSEANAIQDSVDAAENDPMLRLILAMVAMLTGREVRVFDARELQVDSPAPAVQDPNPSNQSNQAQATQQVTGYGVENDRHESYTENEKTSFAAAGVIRTEDGKEINFNVSLLMARSYHEQSDVSIRLGDARKKQDPLVLNFSSTAAQLNSQHFKFDLNSDGNSEDINFVTGGSGFLALDRNSDGKINNGSELFGPGSGNGFAELAAFDADHNGWIDENDAAFDQLRIWTRDISGKDKLSTLKQSNVGALSLARVETPFDLKDDNNALQGQIRSSGVFMLEEGKAGTLQQIDLTV